MTATWTAPGRVNLIGEHVDYNGGLVLPFALQFTTTSTVTARSDGRVHATSEDVEAVDFSVDSAVGEVKGWAAYVAGVVWALRQRGHDVPGLDISIASDVPVGAGLSSSAALSCSVTSAISDELGLDIDAVEAADVSRSAENDYVGVPTGVMDQYAAMLCEAGHVMLLDCRSLETRSIPFDPAAADLTLQLIDTQARHSLAGSEYGNRRSDCEEAAAELGLSSLRDADVAQVATLSSDRLRRRAHHVVTEMQRVVEVVEVLESGRPADIGAYLTAAHESLRDDFEVSSEELDVTVEAALAAGALGARMVGGGFGGCVIALCRDADVERVLARVRTAYSEHGWEAPTVWTPEPSQGAHRVD
ncbi:MAG: galactokinase [Nocardioidaceae bacterium]